MTPEATIPKDKPVKKERTKKQKTLKTKLKGGPPKFFMIKCPLCLDNMKKGAVMSTKCGHVFCKSCLQKALKTKPACPMCRKKILGPQCYHPLYLTANFDD